MTTWVPKHDRPLDGIPDNPLYPLFFWDVSGQILVKREPAGSFPVDRHYTARHSLDVTMPPTDPEMTVVAVSYAGDPPAHPHEGAQYDGAVANGQAVRCPGCRWVSYHPDDIRSGWCSNCQHFTAGPGFQTAGYVLGGAGREHLQAAGYDYVREDS